MSRENLLLVLTLSQLLFAPPGALRADAPQPSVSPVDDRTGGYVDDAACATCHADLAESYREVGMARAFGDAAEVEQIEIYSTPENPTAGRFFHEPSKRWYEMRRSSAEDRPVFRRWHEDSEGRAVEVFESKVDWVLGSGHTSRSYLLQQPGGELFVLPVAWYSQGKHWDMAPGFDEAAHLGLLRRVQRECMFCHNAYPPDIEAQPDRYGDPHLFPTNLPHGTGCQRCHGPGEEHIEAAYIGGLDDEVRSKIVNPGRLSPKLRDDVCEQCHLQPSVALMPSRRFGRRVYSYRPGEDLDDYIVFFDPEEAEAAHSDRFEINHHPYRLRQSTCFSASGTDEPSQRLSCLTCHDPHRKVPKAQRAEHYRQACMSCHTEEACRLKHFESAGNTLPLHMRGVDSGDCAACHMPRRRTRDVIHVVMTDHKIQRLPGGGAPETSLEAPRTQFEPTLMDMDFYLPEAAPDGATGELYKAFGVELIGGNEASFRHLGLALSATATTAEEPWLQLARGYLRSGRTPRADEILGQVLERDASNVRALTWLGLARASSDLDAAIEYLESARDRSEYEDPDLLYNLGVVYSRAGRLDDAVATLRTVVELRPLHANGWMQLGLLHEKREKLEQAEEALRRSLSIEPRAARPRLDLARVLLKSDRRPEALRTLRHGLEWSDDAAFMARALRELGAESGEKGAAEAPKVGAPNALVPDAGVPATRVPATGIKSTDGRAREQSRR
ncbi:MAG: tetratricopeptide repeat protein [Thermoanaerobaculia bacterium]|nr:tetratricopeptide repeat protein [Thermoanaerobaculia bacterium]